MVKNKGKGFTLIELLAVIVILAIIALIATPIILGIVEDARRDAFLRSVELVVSTTDIDIFNKTYSDTYTYEINDGNISNLEIGIKNTKGMNGSIVYDINGNEEYAIHNNKYCVRKYEGLSKAEIRDYIEGMCAIPTDINNVLTGISFEYEPVTYDGTVKTVIVNGVPQGLEVEYPNGNQFMNAGTYTVRAIIKGNEVYSGNHELETTFMINPAPITITVDNKSSIYGQDLEELTYTLEGTIYGNDDLDIELIPITATEVGTYDIEITYEENNNYDVGVENGIYKIYHTIYTFKDNSETGDIATSTNGQLINLGEYGIRYQGSDPDNYVYFNCSDYDNQTKETCEVWRIIGVVDGKVKIIRDESVGNMEWDDNSEGSRSNDWTKSSLKNYLNGEYLNSLITKNSVTGDMISPSTWYLRGTHTSYETKDSMYNIERTTGTVKYETPYIENTKIGLMYPSDFGYAAMETDSCLSTTLLWEYELCKPTNWIVQDSGYEWVITPDSDSSVDAFYVDSDGNVYYYYIYIYRSHGFRPVLYLTSEIAIGGGSGLDSDPYKLSVE